MLHISVHFRRARVQHQQDHKRVLCQSRHVIISLPRLCTFTFTCLTTRALQANEYSGPYSCLLHYITFYIPPSTDLSDPLLDISFLSLDIFPSFQKSTTSLRWSSSGVRLARVLRLQQSRQLQHLLPSRLHRPAAPTIHLRPAQAMAQVILPITPHQAFPCLPSSANSKTRTRKIFAPRCRKVNAQQGILASAARGTC